MTQVSRYPLSESIYQRIFEIFFDSVLKIKNKEEAEIFFTEFLTPTEKIMLAKRISIAVLLSKEYDYRSIKRILHVSFPTIAGVNASLKYTDKGYQQVVERLLKEEKINEILLNVAGGIAAVGAFGGKGSYEWRKVKRSIEKKKFEKPF